ncbi:protein-L-isoaspartate O-methyltransferase family protein [Stagnihabitans tardus]|uniref:Protein-L-isoaspartate O-methyltransferase n=1 Tax=Stagnihabitans tardus TaxID=2699202 RepID=A0AAE5BWH2_9RHOB|nr:methyltransferase domain-containing protein [Stagnihabitans tardus]NBZ88729.1 protein-L-isoaspartate O-methyltransferase [Stagnihabitans tardus]
MTDFASRRVTMVDTQVRPQDVTKFPIIAAMLSVPREAFVPEAAKEAAYVGQNLNLAPGRVVLEPRSLAKLLDALDVEPGERALVVAAGYGYSAAVLAEMGAKVTALESDAAMAEAASARLGSGVQVVTGPLAQGVKGSYDLILIEGGIETLPEALAAQLNEAGRVGAIFMEGALGIARIGLKLDGKIGWRQAFNATAPVLPGFEARRGFVL